ncbi:MAG: restriction endonuclease subunit S [Deltaproteobacteria bacterium]|nr:restriction endonuclease subunit S [Deltaproteobacteria bacterium]
MNAWTEYSIEDIVAQQPNAIVDGPFGSNLKTSDYVEQGIPVLQGNNITNNKFNFSGIRYITQLKANLLIRSAVKEGDLLTVKIGSVGYSALIDNLYGNEYAIIPANLLKATFNKKLVDSKFVFYLLTFDNGKKALLDLATNTAQPALSLRTFKRLTFKYPSLQTQRRISEILSTIDQTIEKTEALIYKYQQIKTGLMHDLFTRGVTADGKLRPPREQAPEIYKETPLGWLPKEWEIIPLGKLADITSGVTLSSKIYPDQKIEVPYLRVANVQDGYLDLNEIKTIRVNQATFENLVLKKGDVLMNEGGDFDKLGRGTVWQGEIENCIHQNHVFRVRVNNAQLRSYYLAFWSESNFGKKYFVQSSKQSTNLASINSTQLKAYPVAIPDPIEQERIEDRINSINFKLITLNKENAKLYYQKSGLMHDLLTGKVQVSVN